MRFSLKSFFAAFSLCILIMFACGGPTSAAPGKPAPDASLAPQVVETVVRIDSGGNFSGTGVVVTPEGHVITNTRTVMGYPYSAFTVGAARVKATVVIIDQKHDLAVLKAETPLPRFATLDTPAGPAKDDPARVFSYTYLGSDPPMVEFKSSPYKVDVPHFKGESAGTMDLADLLIIRLTTSNADFRTDGSPVFSAKNGRLLGITIGKMNGGSSGLIAMPASVIRSLLEAKKIAVPAAG